MIRCHPCGGELTLTLDRPDRANALGAAMVEDLLAQVAHAVASGTVQRLVLRAQGPHFCTGLDLGDLEASSDGDLLHRLVRIETLLAMGLATHAEVPDLAPPVLNALTASALRRSTRADQRDVDLAALVRSAAEPGLKQRITDYTGRLRAQHKRLPG